jgi:hypothetical protein
VRRFSPDADGSTAPGPGVVGCGVTVATGEAVAGGGVFVAAGGEEHAPITVAMSSPRIPKRAISSPAMSQNRRRRNTTSTRKAADSFREGAIGYRPSADCRVQN